MLASRPSSVLLAARGRGGSAARPRAVVPRRRTTSVRVRAVLDVTTATWEKEVLKASRRFCVCVGVGRAALTHTRTNACAAIQAVEAGAEGSS